jgi:polyhydroxyalkanoate synthesis regulator protein
MSSDALFLKIGNEPLVTRFLKVLDDDLTKAGVKFDIVDVKTFEDMEDSSIDQVILEAVSD